jgi:hypothetical protein
MANTTVPVTGPGKRRKRAELSPEARAQREAVKAAKFRELYEFRMPKLDKIMTQVGRLGNRATYSYNEEQAKKVIETINSLALACTDCFRDKSQSARTYTI